VSFASQCARIRREYCIPDASVAIPTIRLNEFVTGAEFADFARAVDERGRLIETYRRGPDGDWHMFFERARNDAQERRAAKIVFGGLDIEAILGDASMAILAPPLGPLEPDAPYLRWPVQPHPKQVELLQAIFSNRYLAAACGRRMGKTTTTMMVAIDEFALGRRVGMFYPDYSFANPVYEELKRLIEPVLGVGRQVSPLQLRSHSHLGPIGHIDLYTLEEPDRAGRGREYDVIFFDECASNKPSLVTSFDTAQRPTLLDRKGRAVAVGTPKGNADDNFFFRIFTAPELGWASFTATTYDRGDPEVDIWIAAQKTLIAPLTFQQEILAQFVDLGSFGVFSRAMLLEDGEPVAMPKMVDSLFAVIDTGLKGGKEHDATGAVIFGRIMSPEPGRLVILDYDAAEVAAGDGVRGFVMQVRRMLMTYEDIIRVRVGSFPPIFVEDAASGVQLLNENSSDLIAIDSKLTVMGKTGRAVEVEPILRGGLVKITQQAYDRTVTLKGITRNALLSQFEGFRYGDREADRRADDVLDCLTYGVLIGLEAEKAQRMLLGRALLQAEEERRLARVRPPPEYATGVGAIAAVP
jgi:hypothetical protein